MKPTVGFLLEVVNQIDGTRYNGQPGKDAF